MKFIIFYFAIIIAITVATPIQYGGWSSNSGWNPNENNIGWSNGLNGGNSKWWPSQNNIIVRKYVQESPSLTGWSGYGAGTGWNNGVGNNGGWNNGAWNNGGWNNGRWINGHWKDNTGYGTSWQYNTGNNGFNTGWKNNYNTW